MTQAEFFLKDPPESGAGKSGWMVAGSSLGEAGSWTQKEETPWKPHFLKKKTTTTKQKIGVAKE